MSEYESEDRYKSFGERIKFLREQWRQTTREVCNSLEIDEKTLRAIEAGKIKPSEELTDMLISHFLLTEDQAEDLRLLLDFSKEKDEDNGLSSSGNFDESLMRQLIMLIPADNKIMYSDSVQVTVNDSGVVLNFTQQVSGQQVIVSKVGMSRTQAEKVISVIQETLNHYKQNKSRYLPSPDNKKSAQ